MLHPVMTALFAANRFIECPRPMLFAVSVDNLIRKDQS
jgi:hypothetical protein